MWGKKTIFLNIQVHHQKHINEFLKNLNFSGSPDVNQNSKIKMVGSRSVIFLTFLKFMTCCSCLFTN